MKRNYKTKKICYKNQKQCLLVLTQLIRVENRFYFFFVLLNLMYNYGPVRAIQVASSELEVLFVHPWFSSNFPVVVLASMKIDSHRA